MYLFKYINYLLKNEYYTYLNYGKCFTFIIVSIINIYFGIYIKLCIEMLSIYLKILYFLQY